jgi:hypothetical protein
LSDKPSPSVSGGVEDGVLGPEYTVRESIGAQIFAHERGCHCALSDRRRGSQRDETEIFPRHCRARERGNVGDVVGRGDLDDVHPDEGERI